MIAGKPFALVPILQEYLRFMLEYACHVANTEMGSAVHCKHVKVDTALLGNYSLSNLA
jgi:hypothetical protein